MTDNFEESLASKPFLFVVGDDRKEFHIHKDFFAQLSPALNALLNGGMKEAREGRVEWHDLDVDTFVRFAKYAYSRDYAEAEPEWVEDGEEEEAKAEEEEPGQAAAAAAKKPNSQSSKTQVIDLTDQTDGNSESSEDEEDEEGDRDDQADEDTSEEESTSDDEDEDDETSSDDDSEFEDDDPNAVGPQGHYLYSCQELKNLPFSITSYTERWELYLSNMLFWEPTPASASASSSSSSTTTTTTTAHGPPPSKRRRLLANQPSDWRSTSTAKLKHAAMRRFLALDTTNITTATTTADAAAITAAVSADKHHNYTPRPNRSPRESFSPVFLSHARLYALAEKYGVEPLKRLALRRLHACLAGFRIYPERLDDLADLVPAVYDNTVDGDPARRMLVLFFACVAEHVKECLAFRAVMRSVGEFADDLFREMTGRLL